MGSTEAGAVLALRLPFRRQSLGEVEEARYTTAVLFAADLSPWAVRLFAFVFGALWGSFFNVAIYRWPRGMSVISPPSHCPSCGAPVRWYLNVPIFGYALLGGRARCCGAKLTPRYVWVELITAVLFVAVAERFMVRVDPERVFQDALLEVGLYWVFVGALVVATFVDLEWMEIPDEVSIAGAALGLATIGFRQDPGATEAAVGAGLGYLVVVIPFVWIYERLRGFPGMGEGDGTLLMMVGAFLGWRGVLFSLVAGSIQGLIVALIGMVTGMPLVPDRPDEAAKESDEKQAPEPEVFRAPIPRPQASLSGSYAKAEPPRAPPGPPPAKADTDFDRAPKMPFGPMLALSALEFLFLGPQLQILAESWGFSF